MEVHPCNTNEIKCLDMWKLVRIWILSSWSFLTVGILLGSWWAYHELGWGLVVSGIPVEVHPLCPGY